MKPALLSVMRRLGLLVVPAVLMFGVGASPAQAQSWHYQNCIKNTCVPQYWDCRGGNTYAYCNTGYKSCQGVCWTSHQMGAAARGSSWNPSPGYSSGPLRGNVRGNFYPSAPSYRSNRGYSSGGSYGSSRRGYGSSGYRSGNTGSYGRSGYGGSSYGGGSYRRY